MPIARCEGVLIGDMAVGQDIGEVPNRVVEIEGKTDVGAAAIACVEYEAVRGGEQVERCMQIE